MRAKLSLFLAIFSALTIVQHAYAVNIFQTIDVPNAVQTQAWDVTSSGVVIGSYLDTNGVSHGWILLDGNIETFDPPGSSGTFPHGINENKQIVGWYLDSNSVQHGFLLDNGAFTTIDVPGALLTNIWGIDDTGAILVGTYEDSSGVYQALKIENGVITTPTIAWASATHTEIHGVLTQGVSPPAYVGMYEVGGSQFGFLANLGNDDDKLRGKNVGLIVNAIGGTNYAIVILDGSVVHGPLHNGSCSYPGFASQCVGISESRGPHGWNFVGYYTDDNGVTHGYLAR